MPDASIAPRQRLPQALRHGLVVAGIAVAMLFSNLGGPALWDEDEPKNAACTLAMRAGDDWVVPTYNGRLRIEKPVLVNWIQLAGCAVVGADETGLRIASAALTVGSCLVTWRIGCLLAGPGVGFTSGVVMAGCLWTVIGGRAATPDAPLVFLTTLAFWVLARAASRGFELGQATSFTRAEALLFGVACGLGVLAKGPVGLVLPLACGLLWVRKLGPLRIGTIVLTAAAVAGPWYAWVTWRTGGEWLHGFLFVHNVERFTSTLEGHSGTLLYYPMILIVGLFPWSIAAGAIAWHALSVGRSGERPRESRAIRLAATWAVAWTVFFSAAGTKLPGYVWPAYPGFAVIVGIFWIDWMEGHVGRLARAMPLAWSSLAAAGLAIGLGLAIAAHTLAPGCEWCGIFGLVPFAGGLLAWRYDSLGDRRGAMAAVAVSGPLTVLLLVAVVADRVSVHRSPRTILPLIAPESGTGSIVSFRQIPPSVIFYAAKARGGEPVAELWQPNDVENHLAGEPTATVVTEASFLPELSPSLPDGFGVIDRFRTLPSNTEFVLVGRLEGGRRAAHRRPVTLASGFHP